MKIKFSKRGLTFSFKETDTFKVGTKYRYIVDTKEQEVILLPDENGRYQFSRKGKEQKPLVDLRNAEIRKAMNGVRYMEVEIRGDSILVHLIRYTDQIDTSDEQNLAEMIDRSDEVTFAIDKETLLRDHGALADMLSASGFFSKKGLQDMLYVYDTVSLFSGAGLLDYPFARDDSFDIRFAVDHDKSACETYRKNIGDHIVCSEIEQLDTNAIPAADLVIGGPCCQPFSNCNRAGNEEKDVRKRGLVDYYIQIVKEKHPLMFVIEQVPQFVTKENGKYFQRVLTELADDYNITYSIVNDSEVGGYSTRHRMVLIGSVKEMPKVIIPNVELAKIKTAGDALRKVTSEWYHYDDVTRASEATKKKMAQVRPGHNYKDILEMKHLVRHSNVYHRLAADQPSITITNWRKVNLMPPVGNRILSVAEAASIMGLDKSYRFYGSRNDRQQQVGNGVTQAIALFIKNIVKTALYAFTNQRIMKEAKAV